MRPASATPYPSSHPADRYGPHEDAASDPEIARLFQELRSYLRLPVEEIAARLRTEPHVIAFLEAGRIDLLPPWAETYRIVMGYGQMAGIDPTAVLQRLAVQPARTFHAQQLQNIRSAAADVVAVQAPADRIVQKLKRGPENGPGEDPHAMLAVVSSWVDQARRAAGDRIAQVKSMRHPVRWVAGVAIGLIILGSTASSGMLQASVNGLSSPLSGLLRALSDQLTLASAPMREGHRWIEVDDPRERRGDKLPSPRS